MKSTFQRTARLAFEIAVLALVLAVSSSGCFGWLQGCRPELSGSAILNGSDASATFEVSYSYKGKDLGLFQGQAGPGEYVVFEGVKASGETGHVAVVARELASGATVEALWDSCLGGGPGFTWDGANLTVVPSSV